jgi:peptidoglycan/xylan/chitin deacetylase (PgdA/CDA1 family)
MAQLNKFRGVMFLVLLMFMVSACISMVKVDSPLITSVSHTAKAVENLTIPMAVNTLGSATETPLNKPFMTDLTPQPEMRWFSPTSVIVPILLYHHVVGGAPTFDYSISKSQFKDQMVYLYQNGYRTITTSALVQAITTGAELPIKPIIITFDDGNENVYFNAYPILKELGYKGMVLIIANRINAAGFLSTRELLDMVSSGWEVGSHGMRHIDLVKDPGALRDEIGDSKKFIENALNINVDIFAYPFGRANKETMDWVKQIGYSAALGLGITNLQEKGYLFYLSRREVKSNLTLAEFEMLLKFE